MENSQKFIKESYNYYLSHKPNKFGEIDTQVMILSKNPLHYKTNCLNMFYSELISIYSKLLMESLNNDFSGTMEISLEVKISEKVHYIILGNSITKYYNKKKMCELSIDNYSEFLDILKDITEKYTEWFIEYKEKEFFGDEEINEEIETTKHFIDNNTNSSVNTTHQILNEEVEKEDFIYKCRGDRVGQYAISKGKGKADIGLMYPTKEDFGKLLYNLTHSGFTPGNSMIYIDPKCKKNSRIWVTYKNSSFDENGKLTNFESAVLYKNYDGAKKATTISFNRDEFIELLKQIKNLKEGA